MSYEKWETGSEGPGIFLKLQPGQKVEGYFVGEKYEFAGRWNGSKFELATIGSTGSKRKARQNFIIEENGAYVSKIFTYGAQVNNALAELQEAGYDIARTRLILRRKGSGLNTEYTVTPDPTVRPLGDAQFAKLKAVPLKKLEFKVTAPAEYEEPRDVQDVQDDIPF